MIIRDPHAGDYVGLLLHRVRSRSDLRSISIAFGRISEQIGVICRIGGTLAGLDLFGSERALARAFPKLVRGSALQALAGYAKAQLPALDEHQLLHAALTAAADVFPAVGLGEELRIDAGDIGGGALGLAGELVHLFAFVRQQTVDGRVS